MARQPQAAPKSTRQNEAPESSPASPSATAEAKRTRALRPFPSCSFAEAEAFARAIYDIGSGQQVRRLTVFDELGKSPESSASRDLITNASKYLLVKGSYKSDVLSLTADAVAIFGESTPSKEWARLRVKLAIDTVPVFKTLYEKFRGLKRPANSMLLDAAREAGIPNEYIGEAVDRFIVNLENVGLLQTLSGSERILEIDHMIDAVSPNSTARSISDRTVFQSSVVRDETASVPITTEQANYETMCFYITPIGDEGTDVRRHADLFLGSIVEPALESLGLRVVRADKIDKPGTISRQVFDYIRKARMVVADLSFHNPNVFYELAVRHMLRKPVVQISQIADRPPFDINQMRTIFVDNTNIYTLVPKLETYRSEIANQVRRAMEDPESVDNPIAVYYPDISVK